MRQTLLYARESVDFDNELLIEDSNGLPIDISGWSFSCLFAFAAGTSTIDLGMATVPGEDGFDIVPGSVGTLNLFIKKETLAGVDDTTGNFTLFGDLIGTPDGGAAEVVGDLRLNVTTAGNAFEGRTYKIVLPTITASAQALIGEEVNKATIAQEKAWAAANAISVTTPLEFTTPPTEGEYALIRFSPFDADMTRIIARVDAGGGSFDMTVLVDGIPEYGPVTVGAALHDANPALPFTEGQQVSVLIENVVDATSVFIQSYHNATENSGIPGVSGDISTSAFTIAGPGIVGREASGAGAMKRLPLGSGLDIVDGELVTTGGGGGSQGAFQESGALMINAINANSLTQQAANTTNIYYYPMIPVSKSTAISGLVGYVSAGTTGNIRFGIYEGVTPGIPDGATLLAETGDLDVSTSSTEIEGAVSLTLLPGREYWLAYVASGAAQMRAVGAASLMQMPRDNLSATSSPNLMAAARSYGALPDPAIAHTVKTLSNHIIIGMRYA